MPHYPLEKVRELAKKVDNLQLSRLARRDYSNLGYYLDDIANCICLLKESNFHKTYTYDNGTILDGYRIDYKHSSSGQADPLYIKFRMASNDIIYIESFHRDR